MTECTYKFEETFKILWSKASYIEQMYRSGPRNQLELALPFPAARASQVYLAVQNTKLCTQSKMKLNYYQFFSCLSPWTQETKHLSEYTFAIVSAIASTTDTCKQNGTAYASNTCTSIITNDGIASRVYSYKIQNTIFYISRICNGCLLWFAESFKKDFEIKFSQLITVKQLARYEKQHLFSRWLLYNNIIAKIFDSSYRNK